MLSYECLLTRLRMASGLYVLGTGTSAGTAPLGRSFWTAAPLDFLRNLTGFSADPPLHSALTRQIINNSRSITISDIFPDREIRSGSFDFPYREILERIPNCYSRLLLKYQLAKANFQSRITDSYEVFELFSPSLIANYNHDGLARRFCGHRHRVLDMHGSVDRRFGSPEIEAFVNQGRDYHLPETSDGLLMGVPESWNDQELALKLLKIGRFSPAFIVFVGYSFARNACGHDDHVSLAYFEHRFVGYGGPVYVVDPAPDDLGETLSERLRSKNVVSIRARWNVLAHALMAASQGPYEGRSINYTYEHLLDLHGGDIAFSSRMVGVLAHPSR